MKWYWLLLSIVCVSCKGNSVAPNTSIQTPYCSISFYKPGELLYAGSDTNVLYSSVMVNSYYCNTDSSIRLTVAYSCYYLDTFGLDKYFEMEKGGADSDDLRTGQYVVQTGLNGRRIIRGHLPYPDLNVAQDWIFTLVDGKIVRLHLVNHPARDTTKYKATCDSVIRSFRIEET